MELHAGRPPAEIADWRPAGKIRLYVKTAAAEAMLEVWDYGRRAAFPVGAAMGRRRPTGTLGVAVDIETSSPWRRHRYWWYPEVLYQTRSLRLSLAVPGGGPATAEVRYFGNLEQLEKSFAYERLGEEAPATAVAGSTSRVSFRIRNTSPLIWEREDVVPVLAGYRLHGEAGGPPIHGPPVRLPARVEPLQEVAVALDVAWPKQPGVYRLEADLVLRHVARFATRLGEPVLRRQVTVTAAEK